MQVTTAGTNALDDLFKDALAGQRAEYERNRPTSCDLQALRNDGRTPGLIAVLRAHQSDPKELANLILRLQELHRTAGNAFARRNPAGSPACRAIAAELRALLTRLRNLPGLRDMSVLDGGLLQAVAVAHPDFGTQMHAVLRMDVLPNRSQDLMLGRRLAGRCNISFESPDHAHPITVEIPRLLELIEALSRLLNTPVGSLLAQEDRIAKHELLLDPHLTGEAIDRDDYIERFILLGCYDETFTAIGDECAKAVWIPLARILLGKPDSWPSDRAQATAV